ncbi:DUF2339 domain-containing protein [Erythrobacter sp. R86502]|uniref:DUF2339 domain-containing protein n=1 Tax=Erythrobacter sp. R86502 TaxID=3093846 RepID=UPI0036D26953
MNLFFILLFAVVMALLWRRTTTLERQIAALSEQLDMFRSSSVRPATPIERGYDMPIADDDAAIAVDQSVTEPSVSHTASVQAVAVTDTISQQAADDIEPVSNKRARRLSFDFEDIFGRRLPIWGGGFALAIAGIFLVRFSIEAGLLTPAVRVALSFVFGLVMLAAAEAAFRLDQKLADPRVRQALSGAGLATLYGAFYLAGTTYGLIGAGAAFVGLAIVTAAAIGLSFRFGLPSAVIGLVGGFAAPLLVDSDSANVPLLSFYLALITGGLAWSGQAQARSWLSYGALAAGLAWGVLMMIAGTSSFADLAALGLYLIVLGTVLPAFLHARGGPSLPHLVAGGMATLQMAVLVTQAGFAPLTWGLYLLIGAALAGLGWRYDALRLGTLVAAGLGLWLMIIWPEPDTLWFVVVGSVQVLIFAGVPLARLWFDRAGLLDLVQLSAVSVIVAIASFIRYGDGLADLVMPLLAATCATLGLLPVTASVLLWQRGKELQTRNMVSVLAPGALLGFAALLLVTPAWLAPVMALAAVIPLLWCHARRDAPALLGTAWAGAAITVLTLMVTPAFANEFSHLGGLSEPIDILHALMRWSATAAPFVVLAVIGRTTAHRRVAEAVAAALAYGVIAQALPDAVLAWVVAAGCIVMFLRFPSRWAAWVVALAIAAAWTIVPLAGWLSAGIAALAGQPFLGSSAMDPVSLVQRIVPLCAALAVIGWKGYAARIDIRMVVAAGLGVIAIAAVHSLYKQLFAITTLYQFELYGMGERSVWQVLLVAGAYGAAQTLPVAVRRMASSGLVIAALVHFVWFTLTMHNPLLGVQHVGPTPIANWLSLAYSTAIAALWLGRRQWPAAPSSVYAASDAAMMALIASWAYSLLRQAFAGSVLTATNVGQTESLLISLLGIVLALGYLWWGSWRCARSWRIGSLVLMLAAVIKVFLVDAAGLEGLLRIASFMALGFSLIGIGWIYSRQLSRRFPAEDMP